MNMIEIGNAIKQRRNEMGLTQVYLSALANTGVRFIIDVERGKDTIQMNKLLDVLDALNLRLEVLLNE